MHNTQRSQKRPVVVTQGYSVPRFAPVPADGSGRGVSRRPTPAHPGSNPSGNAQDAASGENAGAPHHDEIVQLLLRQQDVLQEENVQLRSQLHAASDGAQASSRQSTELIAAFETRLNTLQGAFDECNAERQQVIVQRDMLHLRLQTEQAEAITRAEAYEILRQEITRRDETIAEANRERQHFAARFAEQNQALNRAQNDAMVAAEALTFCQTREGHLRAETDLLIREQAATIERLQIAVNQANARLDLQDRLLDQRNQGLQRVEEHLRVVELSCRMLPGSVTLIDGEVLGRGALGEVLPALYHGKEVVIKRLFALQPGTAYGRLNPEEAAGVLREIRRECETMARLRSPFLVTYYGYTVRPENEDQVEWVVMERLETFDHLNNGAWNRATANQVLLCVARALQYLHERHIIHRDVKPSNILYDRRTDAYKLSDMGEAHLRMRHEILQTKRGEGPRGSPAYMAPENTIEGGHISEKVDMFSLGVTAIELLTRTPPNPSQVRHRNAHNNLLEQIPEITRRAEDLRRVNDAEPMKVWIVRCLAMDAEGRPTANEIAETLEVI